jgi:predicted nucleic acid-binding protein
MREAGADRLFLSTISLAEIRFGIELVPDPDHRIQLSSWLETNIRPMFRGRLLEIDEEILFEWRVIGDALNRKKRTVPEPDLLLSAVARRHRLTVASRDVKHLSVTGIPVFNPWTGESFNQPG